jgi:hypothetical protein
MSSSSYAPAPHALSLAVAAAFLGACAGDTPPSLTVAHEALPTPAGQGSGEPFLAAGPDGVYLSWLEPAAEGGHDFRLAHYDGKNWSDAATVAHGDRFFVNWADFPSVSVGTDGTLWSHWLQRSGEGTYAYGVRVARSRDRGVTWTDPWTPHDDASPTEHGFVSTAPLPGGMGFTWLDGRRYAAGPHGAATMEMTLRHRFASADGEAGPEMLVDGRVCDCCQTSTAITDRGPVVVYRDRSEAEIRDIYIARLVDGAWTEGAPVHEDGWEIAGCPVNGPAVVARGPDVAVAWFTAPEDVARVKVAFSRDAGASFGPPIVVDDGNPAGRVDLLMTEDGAGLVTWIERTGGEAAEIRLREIQPDGSTSRSVTLSESTSQRASGFPRLAAAPDGSVLLAWTDVSETSSQVRVARLTFER